MNGIFRDVYLTDRNSASRTISSPRHPRQHRGLLSACVTTIRRCHRPLRCSRHDGRQRKRPWKHRMMRHSRIMQKSPLLTRHSGTQSSPTYIPLCWTRPTRLLRTVWASARVHVANNQIYVNGQSIKFHGVNRHESDPVTGYAVGFEQTKKDLLMIKNTTLMPSAPAITRMCLTSISSATSAASLSLMKPTTRTTVRPNTIAGATKAGPTR